MSELKNSFEYEFERGFSYINKGENVEAKSITIKAPTNKNIKEAFIIEQEFQRSQLKILASLSDAIGKETLKSLSENREETEEKEQTRESILQTLLGGDANMNKCCEALKTILISGSTNQPTALIDNAVKVNDTIFSDFYVDDTKNILGLYIINFMVSSPAP